MKRRRGQEAVQLSKSARRGSLDSEESEDDVPPTNVVVADGPSEGEEEDEALDFTQTEYAVQMSQMNQSEAPTQDGEASKANKTPSVPRAVAQLQTKALDDLTAKLVRYMLYKGGLKLPIKFADISKDVFPEYKNVSRYFFFLAKKQIEDVFGYRVVQVEDSSSKELYLVLNNASSQEHLQLMNKTGKASTRGFLMMILGLLWCAPVRRLSEDELWKQLARLDPKIKVGGDHPQLGDISQLFKTFEAQLYLDATSELDPDLKKVKYYAYGPRTLMEVGKVQILNFVCKLITGRPPSETQVNEVLSEDS
ncbi:Melanoma-associated antigen F1 [Phytophthora boehmeriae]|uniref:Melanoma-associated antigen F1 n=1 Tax=Phytophthora boehmeriae TaxID=109152 RepID=A0A8T1WTC5_9STRA|nr:Melanoma-associated antigen F1 [Phytophthora boehmeriae]